MEKHSLHHEFPEYDTKITTLKLSDNHFKHLFDEYESVNKEIYHIESGAEATSDETLNSLRLKRVQLKDSLYKILAS